MNRQLEPLQTVIIEVNTIRYWVNPDNINLWDLTKLQSKIPQKGYAIAQEAYQAPQQEFGRLKIASPTYYYGILSAKESSD